MKCIDLVRRKIVHFTRHFLLRAITNKNLSFASLVNLHSLKQH